MRHNGPNSYLFVNGIEIFKFNAKDSEIVATSLCLENISNGWSVDNMKKTGLVWYVYGADYNTTAVNDIRGSSVINEKKQQQYDIKICSECINKVFVVAMSFFSWNALKCVSMNSQEFKARSELININSNEPSFYPYSVKISKFSGGFNNINDPYEKLCIPDVVKTWMLKYLI